MGTWFRPDHSHSRPCHTQTTLAPHAQAQHIISPNTSEEFLKFTIQKDIYSFFFCFVLLCFSPFIHLSLSLIYDLLIYSFLFLPLIAYYV